MYSLLSFAGRKIGWTVDLPSVYVFWCAFVAVVVRTTTHRPDTYTANTPHTHSTALDWSTALIAFPYRPMSMIEERLSFPC